MAGPCFSRHPQVARARVASQLCTVASRIALISLGCTGHIVAVYRVVTRLSTRRRQEQTLRPQNRELQGRKASV